MRIVKSNFFFSAINKLFIAYPTPANLTYFWNFGFYAGFFLMVQIISGIFLAMHYIPNHDLAAMSIEYIMREVNAGWIIRYIHSNGASMFFISVYVHILRGLYYGSYLYPRATLWFVGVFIFFLMVVTAFIGYVLPWGQMSFWAATVITNLVSAIPLIGKYFLLFLWGGYSVDNPTLNRFFSLHYFLPFCILGFVFIHIFLLHQHGSSNPLGISCHFGDTISFFPYFVFKDFFGITIFLFFFSILIFFFPNYLSHSDNYIMSDPMVTPRHIVPEWYFLPFYAILRSVPDKLGGVFAMFASIFCLFLLPFFDNKIPLRSGMFRYLLKFLFYYFVVVVTTLAWLGGKPPETPYVQISQFFTCLYFSYFFFLWLFSSLEHYILFKFLKQ
jgi:ubiquinol-cytochrome c reductase cytochrome b subunit